MSRDRPGQADKSSLEMGDLDGGEVEEKKLEAESEEYRRRQQRIIRHGVLTLVLRTLLRTCTYTAYDILCMLGFKHVSRIGKVLVEAVGDEMVPPVSRSLGTKCIEYLTPVAISSFVAWILRTKKRLRGHTVETGVGLPKVLSSSALALSALYTVTYRVVRQAVIYRLFFRFGSAEYVIISILAIVLAFFREEGIRDLFRITRWPRHICFHQGFVAVVRYLAYSLAFSIPFHHMWRGFQATRRCNNARKLTYFTSIALASQIWYRFLATDLSSRRLWISPLKHLPKVPA
eukprot:Plantae.Rhodophyta-Purpureofilum_apyrenoidigerum.ctg8855.p1 GENE.Plantae.Rhodophyta-Purpureofilum_apyrenoidigerum.ctg8855~~Plantae.Rhodophyta-Purpureofilum_apyrenoidigerum.ctg8855.p1  ORF type:complete len:289 (-),score=22.31 Plantae.Rhodophyta-Purpureofilum_apyrenoidigerum.ctg8855:334-1200(-)